jgi:hypothetical protein
MAETAQIKFSNKEIVTALLKAQGINEGIWGIYVRFGIQGVNIGPDEDSAVPAAIVPILEFGLQKFDRLSNLSVDAATVNPKAAPSRSKRRKR